MRRSMCPEMPAMRGAGLVLSVLWLAGCSAESNAPAGLAAGGHPVVGQPAPEIVGEDADGVQFALSEYRGKVVVVDFWGDW